MDDFVVFDVIARLEIGCCEDEENQDDGVPEGSEEPWLIAGWMGWERPWVSSRIELPGQSNTDGIGSNAGQKRDSNVECYFLLAQGPGK
jgi:hypothetical protein